LIVGVFPQGGIDLLKSSLPGVYGLNMEVEMKLSTNANEKAVSRRSTRLIMASLFPTRRTAEPLLPGEWARILVVNKDPRDLT
jgi:hypothetical protein